MTANLLALRELRGMIARLSEARIEIRMKFWGGPFLELLMRVDWLTAAFFD